MALTKKTTKKRIPRNQAKKLKEATSGKDKKASKPSNWFDKDVSDIINEENKTEEDQREASIEQEPDSDQEINIKDLPIIPLSDSAKTKLEKIKDKASVEEPTYSKVVYLGHLPYGFFEPQMKDFLGQFGTVIRLYISRNRKTGRPRGYGFVEFSHREIAQIVADTMNDYLLFKKKLVCKVLTVANASTLSWPTITADDTSGPFAAQRRFANQYNAKHRVTDVQSLVRAEKKKRSKLASHNIDYQFDGYEALVKQLDDKKPKEEESKETQEEKGKREAEEQKRAEEEQKKAEEERAKKEAEQEAAKKKAEEDRVKREAEEEVAKQKAEEETWQQRQQAKDAVDGEVLKRQAAVQKGKEKGQQKRMKEQKGRIAKKQRK